MKIVAYKWRKFFKNGVNILTKGFTVGFLGMIKIIVDYFISYIRQHHMILMRYVDLCDKTAWLMGFNKTFHNTKKNNNSL